MLIVIMAQLVDAIVRCVRCYNRILSSPVRTQHGAIDILFSLFGLNFSQNINYKANHKAMM